MKQLCLLLVVCLLIAYANIDKFNIVRVYDGDSFFINIKHYPAIVGSNIGVRINGIDTPEMRRNNKKSEEWNRLNKIKAKLAKQYLSMIFSNASKIELRNVKRGKYFRILADVYADNKLVSAMMIKAGFAKAYFGGKK